MAVVGMGHTDMKRICPPDIDIACHNGPKNCTISGPAKSMKDLLGKLQVSNDLKNIKNQEKKIVVNGQTIFQPVVCAKTFIWVVQNDPHWNLTRSFQSPDS